MLTRSAISKAALGTLAGIALLSGSPTSSAAEKIGKVSQPLVAGSEVSAEEQEGQALVHIGKYCSGAMLNSEWVISAAHCFKDDKGAQKRFAGDVRIHATWGTELRNLKVRTLHLLAMDIAILRLEKPLDGVSPDYNMPVYTGAMSQGRNITVYGQGIYQLASGEGDAAVPSKGDQKYRKARFQVSHTTDDHFWFGPSGGAIPAGGDSGGPAFIEAGGQTFLAGISSLCTTYTVEGKPTGGWTWVNQIEECGYAPLAAVWPDIQRLIGTHSCRKYAWQAIDAAEYVQDFNCDRAKISGPRWSTDFDHHLGFCMGNPPASVLNSEVQERFRISQECRISASLPRGTAQLRITEDAHGFILGGGGFAANARVIIRATDAAGVQNNITRNFAGPHGGLAVRIAFSEVCTIAGRVTFTAEDQDANNTSLGTYGASPAVTGNCPPPSTSGTGGDRSLVAQSLQAFVGTWDMRMSDGIDYVLTLEGSGDKLNGTFQAPGRPDLDGVVGGSLPRSKKARFEYSFYQPGTNLRSFGVMTVYDDGTIEGTLDEASDGKIYSWSGQRAGSDGSSDQGSTGSIADRQEPPRDDGAVDDSDNQRERAGQGGVPRGAEAFAGTWLMRNQRGTEFVLTMEADGDRLAGSFVTPGKPKNAGTLSGNVGRNGELRYTFEQPRLGARGKGRMTAFAGGIEGRFTVAGRAERFSWSGIPTDGDGSGTALGFNQRYAAREETVQPGAGGFQQSDGGFTGIWDMRNARGTQFILTLRVRDDQVTGKFFTPGKPNNAGTLTGYMTGDGAMDYIFEQPRLRVRGQGSMTVSGDQMEGRFSVDGKADDYSWSGLRMAGRSQ